jgi:hypothetical protein
LPLAGDYAETAVFERLAGDLVAKFRLVRFCRDFAETIILIIFFGYFFAQTFVLGRTGHVRQTSLFLILIRHLPADLWILGFDRLVHLRIEGVEDRAARQNGQNNDERTDEVMIFSHIFSLIIAS